MPSGAIPVQSLTLAEASSQLAARRFTSVELAEACLQQIRTFDSSINAFRTVDAEALLAAARRSDARRAQGRPLSPLDGCPVSVKDNITTRGMATTASCRLLEHYIPPYDAHVVERLRAAGVLVAGKTNLDELGMGATSEYCAWGPVKHPWDLSRVAGGSSGGAAAATVYGGGLAGIGTDTGGSIRVPAAFCGLVGYKPAYGHVSRWGLVALGSSLDQAGPIARTVFDGALLLDVISGHDPRDATSLRQWPGGGPVAPLLPEAAGDPGAFLRGVRLGWAPAWHDSLPAQSEVGLAFREALAALRDAGARIIEIDLPRAVHAPAAAGVIAACEAYANVARLNGFLYGKRGAGKAASDDWAASASAARGDGFGPEVKRRILFGAYALSASQYDRLYARAARVRRRLADDMDQALAECDGVLTPAAPRIAPHLNEMAGDPLAASAIDAFAVVASLTGLPALVLPVGGALGDGCPAGGLQIMGRRGDAGFAFRLGAALETLRPDWTFQAMQAARPRVHAADPAP